MKVIKYPKPDTWKELLKRPEIDKTSIENDVIKIMDGVKKRGDKALKEYTLKFDKAKINDFRVSKNEINEAGEYVPKGLKKAIRTAMANIQRFHETQKEGPRIIETLPGVTCWQKMVPIERVGLYVPGGTAPLFSTVLMLGIPAKIAGCKRIILCTPPDKNGKVHPAILYAAKKVGITRIYKLGGVQAITAMAYGTESVTSVYKIFGPGNQYVTKAKQLVTMDNIQIDMPAGPSEVAIIADKSCNPEYVASDLLAQAEHGTDSQVILITCEEEIIKPVQDALKNQLKVLPRKELTAKSLENSKCILVKDAQEMVDIANDYAPEHLIIATWNFEQLADKIINAGSVFLGNYTPVSAGDYASGTNHTLPTNGYARVFSGVNLDSFVKKITFQEISEYGMFNLGNTIELMAEAEDLMAHKNSVTVRLNDMKKNIRISSK